MCVRACIACEGLNRLWEKTSEVAKSISGVGWCLWLLKEDGNIFQQMWKRSHVVRRQAGVLGSLERAIKEKETGSSQGGLINRAYRQHSPRRILNITMG